MSDKDHKFVVHFTSQVPSYHMILLGTLLVVENASLFLIYKALLSASRPQWEYGPQQSLWIPVLPKQFIILQSCQVDLR